MSKNIDVANIGEAIRQLVDSTKDEAYQKGRKEGYDKGFEDGQEVLKSLIKQVIGADTPAPEEKKASDWWSTATEEQRQDRIRKMLAGRGLKPKSEESETPKATPKKSKKSKKRKPTDDKVITEGMSTKQKAHVLWWNGLTVQQRRNIIAQNAENGRRGGNKRWKNEANEAAAEALTQDVEPTPEERLTSLRKRLGALKGLASRWGDRLDKKANDKKIRQTKREIKQLEEQLV